MGFKGCQSGVNASKRFLDFWNCREIIDNNTSNSRGRNDMKTLNDEGMKLGVTRGGVGVILYIANFSDVLCSKH